MTTRALCVLFCFLLSLASSRADDEVLRNDKHRVAQVIMLAKLAAQLCQGIEAEELAIKALVGKAGLLDGKAQSTEPPGEEDSLVANSFTQSVAADPNLACSKIFQAFGPDGARLIRRKQGRPIT